MLNTFQTGQIKTVAGNGDSGHAGDGGPAIQACLNEPKNIVFDSEGNLYIADSENHVIRKVDHLTNVISTIAGCIEPTQSSPTPSFSSQPIPNSSDDADPLADPVHSSMSDYTQTPDLSGMVRYVTGKGTDSNRYGGDNGKASQASLNFPSAVAVDSMGNVYIADTMNHRIRRVDGMTGVITTIAGTGKTKWTGDGGPAHSATLNEPVALVINAKDQLYIADQSNNRVRMIELTSGLIGTVAGTGESGYTGDDISATEAALAGPSGLATDQDGNLYIADTFNGRIRKVDDQTGTIQTVLGGLQEFRFQAGVNEGSLAVARPYGISIDLSGCLLITDSDNHLLRKWNPVNNVMTLIAGSGVAQFTGEGGPAQDSSVNFPFGVAVDPKGNIAIADTFNHRIRMIAV